MLTLLAATAIPVMIDVTSLTWLTGCWTLSRGETVIEEVWLPPRGGTMAGVGRTVRSDQTRAWEFLRIAPEGGGLAYIAEPSGQAKASFPMTLIQADQVIFENPAHDFPQRIAYRRTGPDTITATVEGTMRGKLERETLEYRRCPAP